jgi:transposase-like protein
MAPFQNQLITATVRKVLKRLHYPLEVILTCVRWYVAYPLSLRNLEEMMAERGVAVDHATMHRWALKIVPVLAKVFRGRKRPVGSSWRVDETYIKVAGQWKYLYRAVDRLGCTVDFLLTAHRDIAAARRFFERALDRHDVPEKITIDKSGANTAAVQGLIDDSGASVELRQNKYLNNIVEQDHRAIKRRVRPMLGFKSFWSAAKIIAGLETMHMIRKDSLIARRPSLVRSTAVLLSGILIWGWPRGLARPHALIATEPPRSSPQGGHLDRVGIASTNGKATKDLMSLTPNPRGDR